VYENVNFVFEPPALFRFNVLRCCISTGIKKRSSSSARFSRGQYSITVNAKTSSTRWRTLGEGGQQGHLPEDVYSFA